MTKIINIVFCPQDIEDTRVAIKEALTLIKDGNAVALESDVNLIHADCLALLSSYGFKFSSHSKRFIK